MWAVGKKELEALRETTYGGHACEVETSKVLGTYPQLFRTERVPQKPAAPLGRLAGLPPLSPVSGGIAITQIIMPVMRSLRVRRRG